ncbi:Os05g0313199 [Oryza sativa Japonica Group]|uniref:Os05g0313199 protein n=1 Tax=Oryza sativa subsp. japonica TaxID=39947 RepID=A0A0N7KKI4_ORYSJ|nr:Os05g0313199 [Oryza sativa Japonica Group]
MSRGRQLAGMGGERERRQLQVAGEEPTTAAGRAEAGVAAGEEPRTAAGMATSGRRARSGRRRAAGGGRGKRLFYGHAAVRRLPIPDANDEHVGLRR